MTSAKRTWCSLALALAGASLAAAGQFRKIDDSVVDPQALNFRDAPFQEWSGSPNGLSFQQDGIASSNGYQYVTYWDALRRLCVGRRKLPGGPWEILRFEDHRIRGSDIHNVAVLGICAADGTIHLAFDHHNNPLFYRVSQQGVARTPGRFPWKASLFSRILRQLPSAQGVPSTPLTYPRFFAAPGGGLRLYFRIGGSGRGDGHLARYDPDARQWIHQGAFVSRKGVYGQSRSRNAYPHGIGYGPNGRLHVTWCWREGGVKGAQRTGSKGRSGKITNHDLLYAYSDDGGKTWLNSLGTTLRAPIRVDSPGITVAAIPMRSGLMNTGAQAIDRRGRVHVLVPRDDYVSYYHYWRAPGGQWRHARLPYRGVRPKLAIDRRDNLWVIFRELGPRCLCIARAAPGEGADWKVLYASRREFDCEPLIDRYRCRDEAILSVYVQDRPAKSGEPTALRVLSFALDAK